MVSPKTLTCFVFGFVSVFTAIAEAQWSQRNWTHPARPLQGTGRFLGLGYSAGYHTRSHGSDTDYYQPYNARNSARMAAPIENNWGYGWEAMGSGNMYHPMDSRGQAPMTTIHPPSQVRPQGGDFQPFGNPSEKRLPSQRPLDSKTDQGDRGPDNRGEPIGDQSQDLDLTLTGHSVLIKR